MSEKVQDNSAYTEADAIQLTAELVKADAERERLKRVTQMRTPSICTCKGSPFGMDVERCPEHGTFYASPD